MLTVAADAVAFVRRRAPRILDLGVGTGALAERCLTVRPRSRVTGIDGDGEMLAAARRRLKASAPKLLAGDFERVSFGRVDAIVASLALHHVATRARKRRLFARAHRALTRGGVLIEADCLPAATPVVARTQRAAWRAHMEQTYGRARTARYLRAWLKDDVYMPLEVELGLLRDSGFTAEVLWRRGPFAVIVARR
jgi:tRNA (cmo5U34)-methyltransferase